MRRLKVFLVVLLLIWPAAAVAAPWRSSVIFPGAVGQDVLAIQELLRQAGHFHLAPNGVFGPATRAAVIEFQRAKGIASTGNIGDLTKKALSQTLEQWRAGLALMRTQVSAGDTLRLIAEKHGSTVGVLLLLNDLGDTDRLYPGQELVIPGRQPFCAEGQQEAVTAATAVWALLPVETRYLAFTFNDGPNEITRRLSRVLSGEGGRATFFVNGVDVERYPDLLREIIAVGHEAANHGYNHEDTRMLSDQRYRELVAETSRLIERCGGVRPVYFRPSGEWRPHIIAELGLISVWWHNIARMEAMDGSQRVDYILRMARPGAILKLPSDELSIAILPELLRSLRQQGYQTLTLSELMQNDGPR